MTSRTHPGVDSPEAGTRYLPDAILTALIVPTVVAGNPAEIVALVATILVTARTKNILLAMMASIGLGASMACKIRSAVIQAPICE